MRDKTWRMTRELKLRDLELYKITEGYVGKKICHMLFLDYRRPSTLKDFPFLIGIEEEQDFGRANFIKVVVISESELEKEAKEEINIIASGFLENKLDCHWVMEFELGNIGRNIIPTIMPIFEKHNFSFSQKDIPAEKFNFLSQE